jgi:hypothetical protein
MIGCSTNNTILVVSDFDGEAVRSSLQNIYEGDSFDFSCYVPKYPCNRVWEWTSQKNSSVAATILTTGPSNIDTKICFFLVSIFAFQI